MEVLKKLNKKLKKAEKALNKKRDSFVFGESKSFQDFQNHCKKEVKKYRTISQKVRLIKPYTLNDIPEYGHHMTLKDFIECCEAGGFIDYDGSGTYATETQESDIAIYPSDIMSGVFRQDFTHVVWYNR